MSDWDFKIGDRVRFWALEDCLEFHPNLSTDTKSNLATMDHHWGEECTIVGKGVASWTIRFDDKTISSDVHLIALHHLQPLEELVVAKFGDDYL